ncbi:DUF3488 and transglutaminase-like domain-containing protein [Nocardioides sp. YIM 152588]|uniref:transglutaminase family protein n=1 Tax=Nocardioides sp. YIM 152588 TaxID=3158259 RepID=UPI0032E429E5
MSPRRLAPRSDLLLAVVAAATTWGALTAWRGFVTAPTEFLAPMALIAIAVAVTGSLLRWARAHGALVVAAQSAVALAGVSLEVTGSPVPFGDGPTSLSAALATAVDSAQAYAAPIGGSMPSVVPLMLAGGAVFAVLFDALACTLRRVPIAGLALLAIYSIPTGLTGTGASWVSFVLAGAGFLTLLHLDSRAALLRWGRTVGGDEHNPWSETNPLADAVRAGAGRIGVAAIAIALVAPSFVPVLDLDVFGIGAGAGKNQITIRNPRADLRRDLEQSADVPLIRVRTDDPDPSYLRIAVLNRFTGIEWSSGDRDVASSATANGQLPPPRGLSEQVPRDAYEYRVDISQSFDSTWLPTQFPITAIHADGDWRYDEDTLDFLAVGNENAAGMSYTMRAVVPDYGTDGRYFSNARLNAVDPEVLEIPGGLPSEVRNFTQQVTGGTYTDYEKARLLQAWFRTDGGFRYSLAKAPTGSVGQTLATFLSEGPGGRIGYCEQFAAAMAIMARVAGIPARVAIGFLSPNPVGARVWEYSSHDLHAWPELYFSDAGWVRFEPTPGRRAPDAPSYSTTPVRDPNLGPSIGASPAPDATGAPDELPERNPQDAEGQDAQSDAADQATDGGGIGRWLWTSALSLLALAVAGITLPRLLRSGQRARRLAGGPEEAWQEVRATSVDLGLGWPAGRSPRETGEVLLGHVEQAGATVDADAAAAVARLVSTLERHRYAAPGGRTAVLTAPAEPADDARLVIGALTARASRGQARRARWMPRSLWQRT